MQKNYKLSCVENEKINLERKPENLLTLSLNSYAAEQWGEQVLDTPPLTSTLIGAETYTLIASSWPAHSQGDDNRTPHYSSKLAASFRPGYAACYP